MLVVLSPVNCHKTMHNPVCDHRRHLSKAQSADCVSHNRPQYENTTVQQSSTLTASQRWVAEGKTTWTRAQIVGIFCIAIACEIPRGYSDIVAEFRGPFAGSAPSCLFSELARTPTTSVSPFLLLHGSCSRDGSSVTAGLLNVKLYSPTLLYTFRITKLQHNGIAAPNQCYDIVILWSPQRYRKSQSHDLGPNVDHRSSMSVWISF